MANNQFQENWLRRRIYQAEEHQAVAFEEVNELIIKERHGRRITLIDDTELVEFVSCSYLGLDTDPRIIDAASNNIKKCGVTFPAARTRIKVQSFVILESLLNQIFCNSFSLSFASLHLGHLGLLPLLGSGELPSFPHKINGPLFILDKTVHASIQVNQALLSQFGQVVKINFDQQEIVEQWLQEATKSGRTPILIADSVGSMGGINSVKWLLESAEKYDGYAYLDDAHGMSVFGEKGCGHVLDALNNEFHPRLILGTTLAKAFGAVGGVMVLPTEKDLKFAKLFASTYVFGGPPPLSIIDSAIASANIHLSGEVNKLQQLLWENVNYFDQLIIGNIVNKNKLSPIRGILIGDEYEAINFASLLRKFGYAVTTAMYPTVKKGESLLRIALSSAHTKEEIFSFCQIANELQKKRYNVTYARTSTVEF